MRRRAPSCAAAGCPAQAIGASIDRTALDHANTTMSEDAPRGTNRFQTARTPVLLDGSPISNLLGNTDACAPLSGMPSPVDFKRQQILKTDGV